MPPAMPQKVLPIFPGATLVEGTRHGPVPIGIEDPEVAVTRAIDVLVHRPVHAMAMKGYCIAAVGICMAML